MKIAVFGSAAVSSASREYSDAVEIGRLIAASGSEVLCGGYYGMMEAVCKGCAEAGGVSCGAGLDIFKTPQNRYLNSMIKFETLGRRLDFFISQSDAFIGLPGGLGTITEILFSLNTFKIGLSEEKKILLFGSEWPDLIDLLRDSFIISPECFSSLTVVTEIDELKDWLSELTGKSNF